MKKFFSHSRSVLAICVLVLASVWLTVPRDICLTKALVEAGCCCCAEDVLICDGRSCCHESNTDVAGDSNQDPDSEAPGEGHPGCLYVSSVLTKVSGAERLQVDSGSLTVIAVLPVLTVVQQQRAFSRDAVRAEANLALNGSQVHRDNCVFLI